MGFQVLLVEDDELLRSTLRDALEVDGFSVVVAGTLVEAEAVMAEPPAGRIDIILLDLRLPDGEGVLLLTRIRQRHTLPVLVISAQGSEYSKVGLLDAGADDYLVKPFSVDELSARIRAALRHRGILHRNPSPVFRLGDVTVDTANRRVEKGGKPVHVSPREFSILERLLQSAGHVVTHKQLLIDVWGQEYSEHTHYLRVVMGQLRSKLEDDPARPVLLQTETGVGYRLHYPQE